MKWRTKCGEKPPASRNSRSVSSLAVVVRTWRAAPGPDGGTAGSRPASASGRRRQRRPGGEQAARAERTGVLHSGPGVADGQRHLRGLGLDAELGEEPQQGGVGPAVVHDEAGVDGQLAVGGRHPVGVGVAAEAVVGLEEGDVRGARGHPGSRQASNSRTDDGHASVGATGHAASEKSNRAIGSVDGSSEPPAGSTVIPTAVAVGGRALQHHRLVGGVRHQPGRHHHAVRRLEPELVGLARGSGHHVLGDDDRPVLRLRADDRRAAGLAEVDGDLLGVRCRRGPARRRSGVGSSDAHGCARRPRRRR